MHKPFQNITDNDLIEIIKYCFTLEVTISFNKKRERLHKNERVTVKLPVFFFTYRGMVAGPVERGKTRRFSGKGEN